MLLLLSNAELSWKVWIKSPELKVNVDKHGLSLSMKYPEASSMKFPNDSLVLLKKS